MKILSVNNYYNNSFRGFERTVYKAGKSAVEENLLHRNNTYALRTDINWLDLVVFALEKFNNIDKVKTYFYACSDGREPQSFLIALDSIFGEKAVEKFCPIYAKDYDPFVINLAKKNFYEFTQIEIDRINAVSGGRFYEYYEPISKLENRYKAKGNLTDRIIYEVGDFTKEYQRLPKENVILSTRNCWPYFSLRNQYLLPHEVCEHFDKNALLLLGQFDFSTQGMFDFVHNDFKLLPFDGSGAVYEK